MQWPTAAIIVTFVLGTLVAGVAVIARRTVLDQGQSRSGEGFEADGWGSSTALAALIGAVSVSLAATFEASPVLALLIALTMAACSPPALHLLRALRPVSPMRTEPPAPPTEATSPYGPPEREAPVSAVQGLTNSELCTAWRVSYVALQRASTTTARARLVASRQLYLDEMEKRNPAALTTWLSSGARAASGPDRYLHDGPDRCS